MTQQMTPEQMERLANEGPPIILKLQAELDRIEESKKVSPETMKLRVDV